MPTWRAAEGWLGGVALKCSARCCCSASGWVVYLSLPRVLLLLAGEKVHQDEESQWARFLVVDIAAYLLVHDII